MQPSYVKRQYRGAEGVGVCTPDEAQMRDADHLCPIRHVCNVGCKGTVHAMLCYATNPDINEVWRKLTGHTAALQIDPLMYQDPETLPDAVTCRHAALTCIMLHIAPARQHRTLRLDDPDIALEYESSGHANPDSLCHAYILTVDRICAASDLGTRILADASAGRRSYVVVSR